MCILDISKINLHIFFHYIYVHHTNPHRSILTFIIHIYTYNSDDERSYFIVLLC